MKAKVTLRLDTDLLREARVVAAEEGRSLSALLADRLEAIVANGRRSRRLADRRSLVSEEASLYWTPPTSRNELHER